MSAATESVTVPASACVLRGRTAGTQVGDMIRVDVQMLADGSFRAVPLILVGGKLWENPEHERVGSSPIAVAAVAAAAAAAGFVLECERFELVPPAQRGAGKRFAQALYLVSAWLEPEPHRPEASRHAEVSAAREMLTPWIRRGTPQRPTLSDLGTLQYLVHAVKALHDQGGAA